MAKKLSKATSETLFNKFMEWRDKLLDLEHSIVIVEGKRDIEVLKSLGLNETTNHIIGYSQQSSIDVEDFLKDNEKVFYSIVPFFDFDRQGEEYLSELKSLNVKLDMELRMELRNMTRGKLVEFEDLFHILQDKLHPRYWLVLCQRLNLTDT